MSIHLFYGDNTIPILLVGVVSMLSNVFYRYFTNDRYFFPLTYIFISSSSATRIATSSLIYYVMCLEARFYDYLASSDVKMK